MINEVFNVLKKTELIEWIAFFTSIIYVFLASKLNKLCWLFAIISSIAYCILSFQYTLYFESFLQIFYVLVAIYAWLNWNKKEDRIVSNFNIRTHLFFIILLGIISILLGWIFQNYTNQFNPYLDAGIFVFSLFATYLLSIKKIENWIYFIVIDIMASYLFFNRNLYLTFVLYIFYTILAVYGYKSWKNIQCSIHRTRM
ncbi:MAG: nicotinamide mononucleotide transporter [Flavobacteriia bacterium]|nr:nicotinamide mononucleotide transporter [Flavobacteriia bacterium]